MLHFKMTLNRGGIFPRQLAERYNTQPYIIYTCCNMSKRVKWYSEITTTTKPPNIKNMVKGQE